MKSTLCYLSVFLVLGLSLRAGAETPATELTPSTLVPDKQGILRLQAGNDGKSALTLAEELSFKPGIGYLVITVLTNEKHEKQAISHALKLQDWFEKQISTKDHVPIVLYRNERGVGYIYHMGGLPYFHDEHAKFPDGVMTVQGSASALNDARLYHLARVRMEFTGELAEWRKRMAQAKSKANER